MQQWDFIIVHRKGTLHSVPHALSRMYEENVEYADAFSEDVIKRVSWYMSMLSRVRKTLKKYPKWKIEDGRLTNITTAPSSTLC